MPKTKYTKVSGLFPKTGKYGKFLSGKVSQDIKAGTPILVFSIQKEYLGPNKPTHTVRIIEEE